MRRRALLGTAAVAANALAASSLAQDTGPVKIGVLSDMSGFVADISGAGSVLAARTAIEDFGGSVLGKPVELVSADHQNKPDIGAQIVRNWLDVERVDAVCRARGCRCGRAHILGRPCRPGGDPHQAAD